MPAWSFAGSGREPLAELYSPDLVVTVQNLLDARRSGNAELEKIASLRSSIAARAAEFDRTLELLMNGDKRAALKAISTERSRRNLEDTYELFRQLSVQQGERFMQPGAAAGSGHCAPRRA